MTCIKPYIPIVFCLVSSFVGCTSTKLISYTAQSMQAAHFTRILVFGKSSDLESSQNIESWMVEAFRHSEVYAIEGGRLLPPAGNFCDDEKLVVMADSGFDAYMEVSPSKSHAEEEYEYKMLPNGGMIRVEIPSIHVVAKLYEVGTGEEVWETESHTSKKGVTSPNILSRDYCYEVVGKLFDDGLIKKLKR